MKQRITVEQLMELSEEQRKKLRDLWEPERGNVVYNTMWKQQGVISTIFVDEDVSFKVYGGENFYHAAGHKETYLPVLSIGQMIELLHNKNSAIQIDTYFNRQPRVKLYEKDKPVYKIAEKEELADQLWEAVKSVL